MASYTSGELAAVVSGEIKTLSSKFENDDYIRAAADASRETGWAFPVSTDFKILWTKQRMKRHLIYSLLFESSADFRVKQYHLDQPFEHYRSIIRDLDKDFLNAMEENIAEFAGVEAYQMFGTKIDAGFSYDDFGNETTYDSSQSVIINPLVDNE